MEHPIADAKAAAEAAGAGAAEHRVTCADAEMTHDAARSRRDAGMDTQFSRENADIGTEERYAVEAADRSGVTWLNSKRTFDLHQTLDTDSLVSQRKIAHTEDMQRIRFAETEFNQRVENARAEAEQRLRHYEDMHTMRYGVAGEMVEAIANRVWATCPWGAPSK